MQASFVSQRGDFGSRLRSARLARGISLRDLSANTKIGIGSLEALERNEIASLPGGIFTRGFIRTYAVEVGLDPESTVRVFLASFSVDAEVDLSADADVQEGDSAFEHRQQIARVWFQLTVFSVLAIGLIAYLAIAGSSASAAKDTVTPLRVTGAYR